MDKLVFKSFVREVLRNHDFKLDSADMGAMLIHRRFVEGKKSLRQSIEDVLFFLEEKKRNEIYVEINTALL